jgi:autophagy-related protein 5
MSMSKENSTQLWNSVQDSKCHLSPTLTPPALTHPLDDFNIFNKINTILLNPATPLKHIPLRVYVPSSPTESSTLGSFKVVQKLIPPVTQNREVQTIGSALNNILPSLFPSRRDAILAEPILHGAPIPFRAPLEQVMKEAAYADGWIHLSVSMIDA